MLKTCFAKIGQFATALTRQQSLSRIAYSTSTTEAQTAAVAAAFAVLEQERERERERAGW